LPIHLLVYSFVQIEFLVAYVSVWQSMHLESLFSLWDDASKFIYACLGWDRSSYAYGAPT
jgi:hypothetical protein